MNSFFVALINILQIILLIIGGYYLVIALFSFRVTAGKRISAEKHTFALLVAAHNEENVIAQLAESLKGLNYPSDCYDVFVIADNCTDKTAERAREAGAYVWERFDNVKRGKGFALEFAFEKLFAAEKQYEYFCVFDADNIVESDFLMHMNNKINEGYRAVQGYLDSKNPSDSWLTFSYSLWYWINNRINQLAHGNLDLGCKLGGTGFAVSAELIRQYGWGATCLAEDTEFTLKLALSDIKVGWAHDAVVYDEKPLSLNTSIHQRRRWMQGLADVGTRYVEPLIRKTVTEKDSFAFHTLMNFWSDTLYSTSIIFFTAVYILSFLPAQTLGALYPICAMWMSPGSRLLLSFFVWGNIAAAVYGLYSDRKLSREIIRNGLGFMLYLFSWIPVAVMGIFGKNDGEWFHTPHSPKE